MTAEHAARDYQAALHTLRPRDPNWTVPVMTCSALTGDGLDTLWEHVERFFSVQEECGGLARRRADDHARDRPTRPLWNASNPPWQRRQ